MTRRRSLRPLSLVAAGIAAAFALVLTAAPAAHAHVTVDSPDATAGGYTVLSFRVPTESDTERTVGLQVHLPTDTPLLSVRVKPVAGWSAQLVESELPEPVDGPHGGSVTHAVTEIVWTATGEGLGPDEFGEFEVSVGPLPDVDVLFFPAVQTYSDGREVGWVEQAEAGAEAQLPAPRLEIAATSGDGGHGHSSDDDASSEAPDEHAGDEEHATDEPGAPGWTTGLAIGALVVALGALGVAAIALTRSRR